MRLLCNGVALDLEAGATMSFKKTNPLFAFDKLTCERTQSFSLPATPTNDRVLDLAKVPAYYGAGMRRRYDAELQDGTVVKRGYLYVDKYAKNKYNAVFVTGELLGLLAIKNAGKIAEYMQYADISNWAGGSAASGSRYNYGVVLYKNGYGQQFPSVNLAYLLRTISSHFGVTMQQVDDAVRIIPAELKPLQETQRKIESSQRAGTPMNTLNVAALDGNLFSTQTNLVVATRQSEPIEQRFVVFKALQGIRLTFPTNLSDRWFLCDLVQTDGSLYGSFLGDYSFRYTMRAGQSRADYTTDGEPLAGRTIEIASGQVFMLVNSYDYVYEYDSSARLTEGWQLANGATISVEQSVTLSGQELQPGDKVYLQDNLPDVTFTDLLKVYAALYGRALNYSDANGITFDALAFDSWPVVELNSVQEVSELTRTFADYAKRNVVEFDSGESVLQSQRVTRTYAVDNANIDEEKVLQTIPFSEGSITYVGGYASVYVDNSEEKIEAEKTTLATHTTDGNAWLERVGLPELQGITRLCNASTSVTLRVRMTLAEYEALAAKVTILYAGTRYVWTEAQYSKGVVTLKLSKIPA